MEFFAGLMNEKSPGAETPPGDFCFSATGTSPIPTHAVCAWELTAFSTASCELIRVNNNLIQTVVQTESELHEIQTFCNVFVRFLIINRTTVNPL